METYLFGKYLAEKPIQVTKTFLNFLYDLEFKTFLFFHSLDLDSL